VQIGNRIRTIGQAGRTMGGTGTTDSLKRRDRHEDSITIWFKFLDSTRIQYLDSSINDFTKRFPIPATHIFLGNTGNAARNLFFTPALQPGFDPGFHAYDIYKWHMEKVRFFHTTRPYSEINYLLGTRVEQIIELLHTQNINPDWNVMFSYRLINSPGFFKNLRTNHNNYLVTSWLQSRNRRYNNYFVFLRNKMASAESGGMLDTTDFLNDPVWKDRFAIPTRIGGDPQYTTNFFGGNDKISAGNFYNEFNLLLRQQYDLGKKDSLVTDSTVVPLFFPRLRFEHTLTYKSNKYEFFDFVADSAYYQDYYDTTIAQKADTFRLKDSFRELVNDFSIYQYPDSRNLHQFIRVGITHQHIAGQFARSSSSMYNIFGHGEYRNKSKNQKWDIMLSGVLYFTGLNAGDYKAFASIERFGGNNLGQLRLGFENVSRTPSFIYDTRSSFYLDVPESFKKENTTHLFASYSLPAFRLTLSGDYYLLTNYTYITDYYKLRQETSLFNFLQVTLKKTFRFKKNFYWHADIYFQQAVGEAPVHVPVIMMRHRVGYEGNLGFRNLNIAMGLEGRYRSPYKADNYSPLLGQFFYQDQLRISNPRPDISAYVHFRIRPFKAFVRFENLNTARTDLDGFNFTRNNAVAPGYVLPGLQVRVGIYWSFVN
jgi:hypothetical protein